MSHQDTDPGVVTSSENSEEEMRENMRKEWRDKVIERCKRYGDKPLNLMVLGMPGVGKSSFLTNIPAALSGEWHEVALTGHHGGKDEPITLFVKKLEKCGLSDEQVYGEEFRCACLPNFIDLTGLPNENTDILQETIRAFSYGRIPNNESIASVLALGQKKGVVAIQEKYDERDESMVIHRVIILAAADEPIPDQLCECIMGACRPSGKDVFLYKRAIPIFGVMTKVDIIESMTSEDEIRQYKEKVDRFKSLLGIPKVRFAECQNYCDATTPDRLEKTDPDIDIASLKFFYALMDPTYKPDNPDDNPFIKKREAEENSENIKQEEAAGKGKVENAESQQAAPHGRQLRWYEWIILVIYIIIAMPFVYTKTENIGLLYSISYLMLMLLPLLLFFGYKISD